MREERKRQTRELIVRAATAEFAESGLAGARTIDIARRAGVSHGAIFAHFPTRDDLLATVLQEFGQCVTGRTHELSDAGAGVREVLAAHLRSIIEFEPFYARLVSEAPSLPDDARYALTTIQSAVSQHLSAAVERELAAGTIRPVPHHLLFNTWIGLIHHYLLNRDLFAPGDSVIAAKGTELLDHYMRLLEP